MKNRKLTDEIKVDEIGGHKQSKITSNSVIKYNEPKALNGLDLVYWDYIKGLLPDDEDYMMFLGEVQTLPSVDISDNGKVVRLGSVYYIADDEEWRVLGDNNFIKVEGNTFRFIPVPKAGRGEFEEGDIISNGWRSQNKFWKLAQYSGSGDPSLFNSWNVIEEI